MFSYIVQFCSEKSYLCFLSFTPSRHIANCHVPRIYIYVQRSLYIESLSQINSVFSRICFYFIGDSFRAAATPPPPSPLQTLLVYTASSSPRSGKRTLLNGSTMQKQNSLSPVYPLTAICVTVMCFVPFNLLSSPPSATWFAQ